MRPEILFPLFAPVTSLPGVGPRIGKLIAGLAGPHTVDLLWHLPNGLIDRRFAPKIAAAPAGAIATLTIRVEEHLPPRIRRLPYKVRCADDTGTLFLVFFHARPDYLQQVLPIGESRVISGRIDHYGKEIQMTHPDHIGTPEDLARLQAIEPVYPLTTGLTGKSLGKAVAAALERTPELDEWLDPAYLAKQGWPRWRQALMEAHAPQSGEDLRPTTPPRARLAYDELLANQLALALIRHHDKRRRGRPLSGDERMRRQTLAALPFQLTASQTTALDEIANDMAASTPMVRLLQGDVGSGKTIVALLAMLIAVEAGAQAALMAPTDLLARQHFATLAPLAEAAGCRAALLTGREKGRERTAVCEAIQNGQAAIVVGTHAVFQDAVDFRDLAIVVIDEQHRFGVHQRLALTNKGSMSPSAGGRQPDMLLMTATPIPRTLALTAYGDIDSSQLTEKPPGRTPIDTRAMPLGRLGHVIAAVERAVNREACVYWVCPLVRESEDTDLAAAEERHAHLRERFGEQVGLLHGQMKSAERDAAMRAFLDGETSILVATTVIEVGVDVPDATVMVIEHAERFGLAQLHQLRGRIGRGRKRSTCLLLYATPLSEAARSRIATMRETDDGFAIAEEDLRLRGAGEVLGTRQSGMPEFRLADLGYHAELLETARDDAHLCLTRDADLTSERGRALRALLYLFERDAAVKNLRSG